MTVALKEDLALRRAKRYDASGNLLGEVELPPRIFGFKPNPYLIHQVVVAQLANRRQGTHSTRRLSEVSGGGAKPYRQKGTGRARHGTIRAPNFVGGAVAHGPKPRSYRQRIPKAMLKAATLQLFSDRAAARRIRLISDWGLEEPSTKDLARTLKLLNTWGRVLLIRSFDEEAVYLSSRNLEAVEAVPAALVSAVDLIRSEWIVISDRALEELKGRFDV